MRKIGNIGNYYGCLEVKEENDKYYWCIEDWERAYWEEIPKSLYDELIKFEESKEKQ